MKWGVITGLVIFVSVAGAAAQPSTVDALEAQGARQLSAGEVERLVLGSRITITDASGTRSWTDGTRKDFIASLRASSDGARRPVYGKGVSHVDASGAYCARIEWPSTLETWCRRIFSLDGAYYAVSDQLEQPDEGAVLPLQIVQRDVNRARMLSTMWYFWFSSR